MEAGLTVKILELFYYKAAIGNFGDDLNPILWPKLLGDLSRYNPEYTFVGIGSVLDERLNMGCKKIIFGGGVREVKPELEKTHCDFRFVRGPLSAKALGEVPYITDSAYCLKLLPDMLPAPKKRYKKSIIPYFRHKNTFNWTRFEQFTGIHFIDVSAPVSQVLEEIAASERIICGAMHGAIAADILRVPWMRLRFGVHGYETEKTSTLKWNDWQLSMQMEHVPFIDIPQQKINGLKSVYAWNKVKFYGSFYKQLQQKGRYHLSKESVLNEKVEKLEVALASLKNDYAL
ncbi:MAG TPA: hypothetical protein ENH91_03995 [Leeuwenhoekiella sp.]|nr:hypothetical protein [Leeuwenhoekiella sp.]